MVHNKVKFSYNRQLKQGHLTVDNVTVEINLDKKTKGSFAAGTYILDGKKIEAGGYGLELI